MAKEPDRKKFGGWIFFSLVLMLYVLLGITHPEEASIAIKFFSRVMLQMLPVLGLVIILFFLVNLFLQPQWIRKNLGRASGARGWVVAIVGGILSMGPIYPWYAMLGEMQSKGMRNALVAAFLYSRSLKPPLIPLIIYYFGIHYTIVLYFYLIIFSLISGMAIEWLLGTRPEEVNKKS
jgi:uncharacterized membrane protein YraQ (UPF0718 family)